MMNLSEKITALRTERKLSQGDVAEKLEVSRQSVSKWETGQSVPELDKIVKLADLFGVSVDELVRDGEIPRPTPAQGPTVVYVGRRFTAVQTAAQLLGIFLIAGGMVMALAAACLSSDGLLGIAAALAVLGLPLLLAKKHPWLTAGWLAWLVGYPLLAIMFYPVLDRVISPLHGFTFLPKLLTLPEQSGGDLNILAVFLLLYLLFIVIAVLTILLPIFTVRAYLGRKGQTQANRKNAAPSV